MKLVTLALTGLLASTAVQAATLADVDLDSLSFDRITNSAPGATGTSNGIGWSMNVTGFASLTGTQTYNINGVNRTFEDLHIGDSWTITFDQAISSLLIFATNDNSSAVRRSGIDLGFEASDFSTFEQDGTAYVISNIPGYILYEFAAPTTTVTSLDSFTVGEGFDVTFFADVVPVSQVPLPAPALLLMGAVGGLAGLRRLKKA